MTAFNTPSGVTVPEDPIEIGSPTVLVAHPDTPLTFFFPNPPGVTICECGSTAPGGGGVAVTAFTGQLWPQGQTAPEAHTHSHLLPSRQTTVIVTASIADNTHNTGSITLAPSYRLLRVKTDVPARIRLYVSAAARDADLGRSWYTDPTGDHGVIFDHITSTDTDWDLSPVVDGYVASGSSVPWTITNLSGSTGTVTVTLTWVPTEG